MIRGKSDDVISGGGGDDVVGRGPFSGFSKKGKDFLYGGEGDDLMNGGGTFTAAKVTLPRSKGADNAGVAWNASRLIRVGGSCG